MTDTKKVVVNVEGRPKGEKIEVLYLGLFENGGTYDVTDEQVEAYEGSSGLTFPESGYIFAGQPHGEVQTKAAAANAEAEVSGAAVGFEPAEVPATQIDAITVDQEDLSTEEGDK